MYKSFKFVLITVMKVFQIRQNFKSAPILAGAGYQPDLQKSRISARAELRYSPTKYWSKNSNLCTALRQVWETASGSCHFYSASAQLAMQGAVVTAENPSIHLSVTATQGTFMQSSWQYSPMTLVSLWLTSVQNSEGNKGSAGAEWERVPSFPIALT